MGNAEQNGLKWVLEKYFIVKNIYIHSLNIHDRGEFYPKKKICLVDSDRTRRGERPYGSLPWEQFFELGVGEYRIFENFIFWP